MNKMLLSSNATAEEKAHYSDDPVMRELLDDLAYVKSQLKAERKHSEWVDEQLTFATDVIKEIQKASESCTRVNELKNVIELTIENSYVEL